MGWTRASEPPAKQLVGPEVESPILGRTDPRSAQHLALPSLQPAALLWGRRPGGEGGASRRGKGWPPDRECGCPATLRPEDESPAAEWFGPAAAVSCGPN